MSQTILTPSILAKTAVMSFKNALGFTKGIDRQYSDEFAVKGAKIGATINIRKPVRWTVNSGPALNIENVLEESVPLTLSNQKHVDFQFDSTDLTLSVDMFNERYLKPAMTMLANQVDSDGLTLAAQSVFNSVGTPTTTPNTLLLYLQAQQKLDENACPRDGRRSVYINPAAQASTVDALKGLFQSSEEIKEQYESGMMGHTGGMDWYMSQNIIASTTSPLGGTPLTNSATAQTGASLITNGWTSSAAARVTLGDVFTIAGVYNVNPLTKQSTGYLKQFVVTANGSSDGSGNLTIAISPSIVSSGPTQNVSQAAPNSSALTFVGTASQTCVNNILCHKQAFTLGCADLQMPKGVDFAAVASDPETGISMRIVRNYDIVNDMFPCRIDILYGLAALRADWACRIFG